MSYTKFRAVGRWIGFMLLLASIIHVATVWLIPQMTMRKILERTGEVHGFNHLMHSPPITSDSREIVRPSPDVAYSICAYDLDQGPLQVRVPKGADYLSISGYADNTTAFMAVNARVFADTGFEALIATEAQAAAWGGPTVVSPSKKGIIVIRRLVTTSADQKTLAQERQQMVCQPA